MKKFLLTALAALSLGLGSSQAGWILGFKPSRNLAGCAGTGFSQAKPCQMRHAERALAQAGAIALSSCAGCGDMAKSVSSGIAKLSRIGRAAAAGRVKHDNSCTRHAASPRSNAAASSARV